jgi:hypothetical protein
MKVINSRSFKWVVLYNFTFIKMQKLLTWNLNLPVKCMGERKTTTPQSENLTERDNSEKLSAGGRIIRKSIVKLYLTILG